MRDIASKESVYYFSVVPPGLNPGPSACKADVITTTLQNQFTGMDLPPRLCM